MIGTLFICDFITNKIFSNYFTAIIFSTIILLLPTLIQQLVYYPFHLSEPHR
jgi:hypothetical protein